MRTEIEFKKNEMLLYNTKLIPVFSKIEDKEGILMELRHLNKSNNLEYTLIKYHGIYYFVNAKGLVPEYKKLVDDNKFLCPNCGQDLFTMSEYRRKDGTVVHAHLKHYKEKGDCIFKNFKEFKAEYDKNIEGFNESDWHKSMKLKIMHNIEDGSMNLDIPTAYKIIENKDYSCRVEFQYKNIQIIKGEIEKKVLSKDKITNGYRPDLVLTTKDNEIIYVEVTLTSGKASTKYGDIWRRLNKPVIEVRVSDCIKDKDDFIKFRWLYNPLSNAARKEQLKVKAKLANKEYLIKKFKQVRREFITKNNLETYKYGREYLFCYKKEGDHLEFYTNYWWTIIYNDASWRCKIPYKLGEKLKFETDLKVYNKYIP